MRTLVSEGDLPVKLADAGGSGGRSPAGGPLLASPGFLEVCRHRVPSKLRTPIPNRRLARLQRQIACHLAIPQTAWIAGERSGGGGDELPFLPRDIHLEAA